MSWVSVLPVRAIRRFTVRPVLPEPLQALGDLSTNLRWSWSPETQDVFAAMDPDIWRASGHDPVKTLGAVSAARLDELASDEGFLAMLETASDDLQHYLTDDRWFQRNAGDGLAPRDRATSRRSTASPRCCRSTPAGWASSPATT